MVEPHVLFAHILSQTRQNVQLLMDHDVLTEESGQAILSKLQVSVTKGNSDNAIVDSLTQQTQRLNMSPSRSIRSTAHRKVEARAIWEWSSGDPKDLSFQAGEIIEIVTETNVDWWMGRNRSGKEGLFPSNYVEKLPPRELSPISVSGSSISRTSGGFADPRYSSSALSHPSPQQYAAPGAQPPQAQYPPPAGAPRYYPPGGPPAGPPQNFVSYSYVPPPNGPPAAVVQQPPSKGPRLGSLGNTMAQSAASGVGFGAGAAIGSGVINSIF